MGGALKNLFAECSPEYSLASLPCNKSTRKYPGFRPAYI